MRRIAASDGNQPEIVAPLDGHGIDTRNNSYKNAGDKVCVQCRKHYHSYDKTRKFCGLKCRSISAVVRENRPCAHCGNLFHPNVDARKYCSRPCTLAAKPKVSGYIPRPRLVHTITCENCGNTCRVSPSKNRKFCSYACHLDSGGAQRSGDAAALAKSKYGAKKDANHHEIFQAIEIFTAVKDLSDAGRGIPDGLAWVNDGWHLFDVKNPLTGYGKRGLNPRQQEWATDWRGGPVFLIYTVEEAIQFAKGNFDGLKRFPDVAHIGALRGGIS